MRYVQPDYLSAFRCIADRCRHTCCRGWEIDIDADTLPKYLAMEGAFGEKLRANIAAGDSEENAHFILGEDERCPFLRADGLCELILTLGEDSLCQICTDHPRFRAFWTNREELGLGMACEAAARLILSKREKTRLIITEDTGDEEEESEYERELLALRNALTEILQDRSMPTDERVRAMLRHCELNAEVLRFEEGPLDEIACEQFAVYLLYRHLADALYDGRVEDRLMFVAESYARVRNEWARSGSTDMGVLVEMARQFSEDVEYDTDTWGMEG